MSAREGAGRVFVEVAKVALDAISEVELGRLGVALARVRTLHELASEAREEIRAALESPDAPVPEPAEEE